jgi:Alginate export
MSRGTAPWHIARIPILLPLLLLQAQAQPWDLGSRIANDISAQTEGALKLGFEIRGRYESRTGTTFGKEADIETGLIRTRLSLSYSPVKWLKLSGMAQDARAPWYGTNAPNTCRDPADLHEAYVELFPGYKKGFGLTAGRMMLNYGEGRLIGTPQWSNLARTYDQARLSYRSAKVQVELLFVSPVKVRVGEFNRPVPGDHVWGAYNSFPRFLRQSLLEIYVLRHEQNRPGGFTAGTQKDGTDRLGINTFGLRTAGPLGFGLRYSIEAAAQNGKVGPASHRAEAWFSSLTRRWTVAGRPLDATGEYKYASGTDHPEDASHSGTFDQVYAANHDKFGHEDLFGWRNLHNSRFVTTFGATKSVTLNLMYDNYWLASRRDGIYSGSGKLIARSLTGTAGRFVGQEVDVFATYKYKNFTLGAGYGHFLAGGFIQRTTPGVGPSYLYVFHTYSL